MSTKNYFMFTLFLLSSLSNVNAMDRDTQDAINGRSLNPTLHSTASEEEMFDLDNLYPHGTNVVLSSTPQISKHFLEEIQPKKAVTLETILEPLSHNLYSAGIKAQISCKPLGYINEYLNPDQKVIYEYLPRTKLAEDYVIVGQSAQEENMFSLYMTSLRSQKQLTDVIFWRGDRVQQAQFTKPATTGALATTTLMCVLNTIQETGVPMLATTGFLPTIVKEMEIPVLETAEVPRPTRVFRVNKGNPLSGSNLFESQYRQREQQSLSESTAVQDGEFYTLEFLQ